MTRERPLDGVRRRDALVLGGVTAGLSITLATVDFFGRRPSQPQTAKGLVLPTLAQAAAEVSMVKVVLSEGSYSLVRRTNDAWEIPERGNFPVSAEPLNQLAAGLAALRFKADKTRNPALFHRLGVDDPYQGGSGALIELSNRSRMIVASLIVGVRPGGTYVRFPEKNQAYEVIGKLPPLQDLRLWLDLTLPPIDAARIVRVSVNPTNSAPYLLGRTAGGGFGLIKPTLQRLANADATKTGLAITNWRPIDVLPRKALSKAVIAGSMDIVTVDGLAIRGTAKTNGPRFWIEIDAANVGSNPSPDASAINSKTSNWAFEFTRFDWKNWITPLSEIAL